MLARVQTGETGFNSRNLEITTTMARVPLMLAINPLFPCKNLKQSAPVSAGSIIMASPPLPGALGHFTGSAQPLSVSHRVERGCVQT